jgi:hypothetical protein
MQILDSYVLNAPNHQNVLDLFKGEWSSQLPGHLGLLTQPGTAALFDDGRVIWAEQALDGFEGCKVLELGPLEGGHSYMLQNRGANRVVSIEANTRAFLKCLCIKEILKLDKVDFRLGDFMSYLRADNTKYDIVFASGVLYHMEDPIELIKLISSVSDKVFLWTHYHDENIISSRKDLAEKFGPVSALEYEGVSYDFSRQAYQGALNWQGFCGGPKPVSKWLTRDSIIKALKHYGFLEIQINFDVPDSQNGPAFAICAKKAVASIDA